jgi:hypothetical protein
MTYSDSNKGTKEKALWQLEFWDMNKRPILRIHGIGGVGI